MGRVRALGAGRDDVKVVLFVFGILLLDQGTKLYIERTLAIGESVPLIKGVLYITHIQNPGAAFGLMANQTIFFVITTLLVITAIIHFYRRLPRRHFFLQLGLALGLAGAMGNLIDRLRLGYVVDIIDLRILPTIFNLADTAIVLGVGILLLVIWRRTEERV
ncbi:MAG: signal peptidase II [Syntrophothermus sp.]